MTQKDTDLQKIKKLIDIMKKSDLDEVEIKHGDDKILLKRSRPAQPPIITTMPMASQPGHLNQDVPQGQAAALGAPQQDDSLIEIKSPIVGTFYRKPGPDTDFFVEIDSHITEQKVVCIIEAMKVMNEIKADVSGTIVEILATDGQAVEYGQPLFRVRPD